MRAGRSHLYLAAVAVLAAAFGVLVAAPARPVRATAPPAPSPVAYSGPAGSLSSAWYCVGAVARGAGSGTVLVADLGRRPLVAVVSASGRSTARRVRVGGLGQVAVPLAGAARSGDVAATVLVRSASATVALRAGTGASRSEVPCAREVSSDWYLAAGSTSGGSDLLVDLYDPLPTASVVDLSFATSAGERSPADYQGIVVGPRSVQRVDVGRRVLGSSVLAVTAHARVGQVVAGARVTDGAGETTLAPASPAAAPDWYVPAGIDGSGAVQEYTVYDPSPRPARVSVRLQPVSGPAVSFELDLRGGQVRRVVSGQRRGVPEGEVYSATFRSRTGVVVESSLQTRPPSRYKGWAISLGSPAAARGWAVAPAASPESGALRELVLQAPSGAPVRASLRPWSAAGTARQVVVAAGVPLVVDLGSLDPHGSGLTVSAGSPLVVEEVRLQKAQGDSERLATVLGG
ncbi:MAG: DUF5719 family protein [Acidimicrobiales bacterium]